MRVILTIAGFDPSGGAGVLADIKTFAAFDCFGAAAITSLTSQNTDGVYGAYHQPAIVVRAQLEPLLTDYKIAAVKIGMLPTVEVIELVSRLIERFELPNIVIDPVIRSSSGYDLIDDEALDALQKRLMPLAVLVTPNLDETAALLGEKPLTIEDMQTAAQQLAEKFTSENQQEPKKAPAILIKGGHLRNEATDVLYAAQSCTIFSSEKIATTNTHGTGCTLSSAIAALLGRGEPLAQAVSLAKKYVSEAIKQAPGLGKGHGPLNHFVHY